MRVKVNGADHVLEEGITVQELLGKLGLQGRLVVVELNRNILSRDVYDKQVLQNGDVLELVHFVGGGY